MKIRIVTQTPNQGSALAVTLLTCGILGLLMGSYLYIVQGQRQAVARSQSWNQAIVVAEAGIDEALALMNSGAGTNFAVNPWKDASGGSKTSFTNRPSPPQFVDPYNVTSYYTVTIDCTGTNPVIRSTSYVPAPLSKAPLKRTIQVRTKPRLTFPVKAPMIVRQSFDSNGSNVGTDSFDSRLGPYNPATRGTNGDVVSLSTNVNSIMIGNGKIDGTVRTPPGGTSGSSGTTATIGSSGSVGDSSWVTNSSGFQSGHFKDDFTLSEFPDVTMPSAIGNPVSAAGATDYAPDTLHYDYLLGNLGTYTIGDLNGSLYVGFTNTILYVTDRIYISGNNGSATTYTTDKKTGIVTIKSHGTAASQIHIAPDASLTIYMAGTSTTISGNGVVNDGAQAKNFQYYGTTNNTSISIKGNGSFFGTIYAPEADFTLVGSGKSTGDDFTGSSLTKSTTMTGNFNFHYDESLGDLNVLGGYEATSWEEIASN